MKVVKDNIQSMPSKSNVCEVISKQNKTGNYALVLVLPVIHGRNRNNKKK